LHAVPLKLSPMAQTSQRGGDSAHRDLPKPAQANIDPRKVEAKKEATR